LHDTMLPRKVIMVTTTFALTCVAWILFRAQSMSDAWYIFTHLGTGWNLRQIGTEQFLMRQMPAAFLGILILELGQLWQARGSVPEWLSRLPMPVRWTAYAGFVLAVMMLGIYRNEQFIYFQF
jgi:hypothetical protein